MALTKEDIVEGVSNLTQIELNDLVKALEEKFGVSAASMAVATPVGGGGATAAVEEKTEFNVILSATGEKKINVIKVVRELTGLGLKDAKDLVEAAPKVLKENVNKDEAESFKKKLEEVGATVKVE